MIFSALSYASFLLVSQVLLPDFNPRLEWKTIKSEHFELHFDLENADAATKLLAHAEPIYQHLSSKYHWEPATPVHLVLVDTDDTNGLSTPLPYNTIYLFAGPPSEDSA